MQKTLGGDRLGSGAGMKIAMKNYERSNHDLGYLWRSSLNIGTLVPFMKELLLPGDTFTIKLANMIRTLPTNGPLFGSFKVQMDVFVCPLRLINGALHNNVLNVGMNMDKIIFPKMNIITTAKLPAENDFDWDHHQIAPDALLSYLGTRGIGIPKETTSDTYKRVERKLQCAPEIFYYDIFKYYYANKQEKDAYVIMSTGKQSEIREATLRTGAGRPSSIVSTPQNTQKGARIEFKGENLSLASVFVTIEKCTGSICQTLAPISLEELTSSNTNGIFAKIAVSSRMIVLLDNTPETGESFRKIQFSHTSSNISVNAEPTLVSFPLENIDKMREKILKNCEIGSELVIDPEKQGEEFVNFLPYTANTGLATDSDGQTRGIAAFPMTGLCVKTYQSDIFNNWIATEWIDEVSRKSNLPISANTLSMDALNLHQKAYNYFNRQAAGDGTYQDWFAISYGVDAQKFCESPIYIGGMSCELIFDEVISTAASEGEPIGTLAGRGNVTNVKGGIIDVHGKEPSYVIGLVSVTPRIDYSQGNDWDKTELLTYDNLHKPEFDGIGYQDLVTENMAWWATGIESDGTAVQTSAGKQPAWINYMTQHNRIYGDFTRERNAGFMVIDRNYTPEVTTNGTTPVEIKDLTTYIDPALYNYLFAKKDLTYAPIWMQISVETEARRKMSAAVVPTV